MITASHWAPSYRSIGLLSSHPYYMAVKPGHYITIKLVSWMLSTCTVFIACMADIERGGRGWARSRSPIPTRAQTPLLLPLSTPAMQAGYCLRCLCCVKWQDHILNIEILERCETTGIGTMLLKAQFRQGGAGWQNSQGPVLRPVKRRGTFQ